jgi:hypothetical protein
MPCGSESEIDFVCECLVFAPALKSFVGRSFTSEPTPLNRQDSVIKDLCVDSRHAEYIYRETPLLEVRTGD